MAHVLLHSSRDVEAFDALAEVGGQDHLRSATGSAAFCKVETDVPTQFTLRKLRPRTVDEREALEEADVSGEVGEGARRSGEAEDACHELKRKFMGSHSVSAGNLSGASEVSRGEGCDEEVG